MADQTQEELGKKCRILKLFFSFTIHSNLQFFRETKHTFIVLQKRFSDLLERLFLRLGAAQTDDQLEKTVGTFLTPLLLKVASTHEVVKKKVSNGFY
jgi:hypothetical protein